MKTGYLIDMDGVIYRENHLIPGAVEFVDAMLATGTPFLFLTNNSAPTAEDLAVKLKHLGIRELNPRHFYASALNTADFLSETHPNCTAFVIGESGLAAALHEKKIANDAISPNYVVVGEGAAGRHQSGQLVSSFGGQNAAWLGGDRRVFGGQLSPAPASGDDEMKGTRRWLIWS
jgi:HAD superfamily hydrolase (TIGR01450 family)